MRITADTNLLVRAAVRDNPEQTELAEEQLAGADVVAIATQAPCEFVWVVGRAYKRPPAEIASSIRELIGGPNVSVDRPAVDVGLAFLDTGGDFADGVIAYQGRFLGGDIFVSFDTRAVRHVTGLGRKARLLA